MPTYNGPESVDLIVADDEEDNLDVCEMSLTCHGFDEDTIFRVTCGEEALEKLDEVQDGDEDRPLVLVLDLNMPPKMGGAECAEKVRQKMDSLTRKAMLVCCSAGKVDDLKAQAWASNFDHFCSKPFTPQTAEDLADEIEKWVDG
mmetsp:Transcript_33196/g.72535  ORF Transcript_33196/g.72535 Transcript_33196/m.72535 type:complete len:145 (+) Transcript_33196:61-495(+)